MAQRNPVRLIKVRAVRLIELFKSSQVLFWLLLILLLLSVFWPKRDIAWEWREEKRIENKIAQWEEILEKYPGYRDAYLRLAVLNWQINNSEKAKEYLEKAKELDPNFETTKELEEILLHKNP